MIICNIKCLNVEIDEKATMYVKRVFSSYFSCFFVALSVWTPFVFCSINHVSSTLVWKLCSFELKLLNVTSEFDLSILDDCYTSVSEKFFPNAKNYLKWQPIFSTVPNRVRQKSILAKIKIILFKVTRK